MHTTQRDDVRAKCTHTPSDVQSVTLRIGSRLYREFRSLLDAIEHPLGRISDDAELVSGDVVLARLVRIGGKDMWMLVGKGEGR